MLWNPARPLVFTHLVATADVRYSPRPRTRDSRRVLLPAYGCDRVRHPTCSHCLAHLGSRRAGVTI
jgi:hypothetical protein